MKQGISNKNHANVTSVLIQVYAKLLMRNTKLVTPFSSLVENEIYDIKEVKVAGTAADIIQNKKKNQRKVTVIRTVYK